MAGFPPAVNDTTGPKSGYNALRGRKKVQYEPLH